MPSFGRTSSERRDTCDHKLVIVLDGLIKKVDFTIVCGYRGQDAQNKAHADGASTKTFPNSKHNTFPSVAVDIAPYHKERPHIRWPSKKMRPKTYDKDLAEFYILAVMFKMTGERLGIPIRSGFDWDGDWNIFDQSFDDLPHHELLFP